MYPFSPKLPYTIWAMRESCSICRLYHCVMKVLAFNFLRPQILDDPGFHSHTSDLSENPICPTCTLYPAFYHLLSPWMSILTRLSMFISLPIYSILNIAARVILFQSQIMSFNSPRLFNGSHLICYFSKLSSICSPGRPFSSTPTCSIHTSHPPASLSWRELLSPSSKHFSSDFYLSNSLVFFQYVFKCYLYNFSHPDHSV